jgi:hypothetical protein
MHKIDGAGHVNGQFVNEDAATNRPPTEVTAEWLSAVQNELITVIESSGTALDKANNGQLLAALKGGGLFDTQATGDSSRKVATTAFVHQLLAALPGDKFLQGLSSYDATTNVMKLAMSDGSTVDVDMTALINDAVSSIAVVTAVSDTTFVDNSSKAASTSWIRGAMSAIAVAAGFSYSFSTNGYFKFPSWLAGFTMQWGTAGSVNLSTTITFPIAFLNSGLVALASYKRSVPSNVAYTATIQIMSNTSATITTYSGYTDPVYWVVFGY